MRKNRAHLIRAMRALNRIDGQYDRAWRALGIKRSLFVLLYACVDGEPQSQKEICDEWYLPRSTLNTVVLEQVKAGNVELVPRGDKEKDVRLTKAGQAFAEQTLGPLLDAEDRAARKHLNSGFVASLEEFASEMERAFAPIQN